MLQNSQKPIKPSLLGIKLVQVDGSEEVDDQFQPSKTLKTQYQQSINFKNIIIDSTSQDMEYTQKEDLVKSCLNLRPPKLSILI